MALREELELSGRWLFRWRSFMPLFLAVPILLAMQHPDYLSQDRPWPDYWGLFCMAVSLVGLGIRVLTVGCVPQGTSGRNTKAGQIAEVLNTTGMYSIVRHPLYLANFVVWLGVAMYCGVWWLVAIVALLFWIYYERIMFAEEEFLRRKFGDVYVQWAEKTPAFFPKLKGWRRPELPFSLRTVLRREYPGLFGIIAAFYVLKVYERVVVHRDLTVEPVWSGAFAAGLAIFLTLRTLKRKTRLLAVEGR
jgi:protein-S-isoprenylcysteine O-methyltransferase Ste14